MSNKKFDLERAIDNICKKEDCSIYRLAHLTGFSPQNLWQTYKRGSISFHNAVKICDGVGISLNTFYEYGLKKI